MIRKIKTEAPPPFERQRVGRYDVIYPLAVGGMANVYVGRLSGMAGFEKLVTLKLIHSHLSTQREFVDMFLDEARIAARIHHPNIGEIYEIVEDRGQLFIAAEFVDGNSLRHLLGESKRREIMLPCTQAAWICAEVCQGLQFVHDLTDDEGTPLHLVHRDISPSNILISYNGWVKLIDFGVAFAENRLSHTSPGNLKGKIGYISPEQIKGEPLDCRADIFSLGVILYLFATGKHPFPGKSEAERLKKTLTCDMTRPSKLSPTVDGHFECIILKAMAVSPKERYQQASELETALREYISASGEKFGASELGPLMQSLFAEERESHQKQVLEFKQKQQQVEVDVATDDNVVYLTRSTDHVTKLSTTVLCRPTSKQLRVAGGKWKMWTWGGGAFLVFCLAAALLYGLGFVGSDGGRSHPVASPETGVQRVGEDGVATEKNANIKFSQMGKTVHDAKNRDASGVSNVVRIPVTLQPAETELLLEGAPIEVASNAFRLPNDGQQYEVEARASGYVTAKYTVRAQKGETLEIKLSRSSISTSNQITSDGAQSKMPAPIKRKARNKSGKSQTKQVLNRNPY
ncbi:MAG: protein kinase [Deltaproteobacteria bacterium]|nr:protein kinase [Deltaproteobacteria bacterium]